MPLNRVPGQPFDALVDHADGRRGCLCIRRPARPDREDGTRRGVRRGAGSTPAGVSLRRGVGVASLGARGASRADTPRRIPSVSYSEWAEWPLEGVGLAQQPKRDGNMSPYRKFRLKPNFRMQAPAGAPPATRLTVSTAAPDPAR